MWRRSTQSWVLKVPFLPGGAGAAIKAARTADNLADGAQSLERAGNIAKNAKAGKPFDEQALVALKKEHPGIVEQLTLGGHLKTGLERPSVPPRGPRCPWLAL